MSWITLRNTDWETEVTKSQTPVVVEFWHQNCPTCKKIEPAANQLPTTLSGKAKFARLNVLESRENRRLAIDKGVIGTPTFKVYCNGVEKGEVVGLETLNNLEGSIKNLIEECAIG